MSQYSQEILSIAEVFEEEIKHYLREYIEINGIEDVINISQSKWNAALKYIYNNVFKGNKNKLKAKPYDNGNLIQGGSSNNGAYNIDLMNAICDSYIDLCFEAEKEVSIFGFCRLTGVDEETVWNWGNGVNRSGVSTTGKNLKEKLSRTREESLSDVLVTGKRNPVGTIAILNNKFGWADNSRVVREERITAAPVTRDAIMAEFGHQIEQKPQEPTFSPVGFSEIAEIEPKDP